jgi:hypothetical protein
MVVAVCTDTINSHILHSHPTDESKSVVFGSSCSHVYHRECILEWLNKPMKKQKAFHDDCPNCRQRMWEADTYEIVKDDIARREAACEQRMTLSMLDEQM